MNHIGIFEGIGGFSIAGHWAGWQTIAWCEYASFPQKVLRHYFPTADELHDVTTADFTVYRGWVDVLTGGFPCQPFSHAGQRRGAEDDRYLWPHMLRAIQESRPTWVVGENVAGLASMAFPARALGVDLCTAIEGEEAHRDMEAAGVLDSICADLEREGYDVQPIIVPACATNAPHRRDRIWIIGYNAANANERSRQEHGLRTGRKVPENGAEGERAASDTDNQQWRAECHGTYSDRGELHRKETRDESARCNISRPVSHTRCDEPQQPDQPAQSGQLQRDGQPCHEPQPLHGRGAAANACKYGLDTCQWIGEIEMCNICDDGGNYQPDDAAQWESAGNTSSHQCQRSQQFGGIAEPITNENEITHFGRPVCSHWEIFPTQPPVCGGNDGISELLDFDALFEGKKGGKRTATAAYNHWRNETIKAYGNAIVPQVFLEIAKAINAVTETE